MKNRCAECDTLRIGLKLELELELEFYVARRNGWAECPVGLYNLLYHKKGYYEATGQ